MRGEEGVGVKGDTVISRFEDDAPEAFIASIWYISFPICVGQSSRLSWLDSLSVMIS